MEIDGDEQMLYLDSVLMKICSKFQGNANQTKTMVN